MGKSTFHASTEGVKEIIAKYWNVDVSKVKMTFHTNAQGAIEVDCKVDLDGNPADEADFVDDFGNNEAPIDDIDITKAMIRDGIENKIVKFDIDPNMGAGTICKIGENWFYFGGITAEESDPEEYVAAVPTETIVDEIYDVLEDFKVLPEYHDEYRYYYYYLKEQLNTTANT